MLVMIAKRDGHSGSKHSEPSNAVPGFCASTDAVPVTAPHKNLWKNFNIEEATAIRDWLWAEQRNLNLTQETKATDL
jgi:primary-amine oxidase